MSADLRTLAEEISMEVRKVRLERIGEDPGGPVVAFDDLPDEDRDNWMDVAHAAATVLNRRNR